jgi:hypothetical protein
MIVWSLTVGGAAVGYKQPKRALAWPCNAIYYGRLCKVLCFVIVLL